MIVQRIYTDTSVIGGCFDPEFATWSNGLLEDFRRGTYLPVVSDVVAAEVEDAPEPVRAVYAELLQLGAEFLEVDEAVLRLADAYQQRGILTPRFYDDGAHIALATAARVDVLVSWSSPVHDLSCSATSGTSCAMTRSACSTR